MLNTLKNFLPIVSKHWSRKRKILAYLDIFGLFQRDPFGNWLIFRRLIIFLAGWPTWWRIAMVNRLQLEGTKHLLKLPNTNVFFISNHQTYFADVITFYHIFCNAKWGMSSRLIPFYLFSPRARTFYVAAKETMQNGLLPRLFSLAGAILVQRSWRAQGTNVQREVDTSAGDNINKGLEYGWVVSFPQGTTSPYAPVRKGTAHIIKENNPIVVPVVIDGFRRAFNKTGLAIKKRDTTLRVRFKEPIYFHKDTPLEEIVEVVTNIIEQNIPENILEWKKNDS